MYAIRSYYGGKFQIIDKYIYNNNWNDFNVKVFQNSSTDPTQMIVSQNSSAPTGDRRGDIAILASNTPYVDCKVKGSGGQSIALGFIEDANFSQAPASYGEAIHLNRITSYNVCYTKLLRDLRIQSIVENKKSLIQNLLYLYLTIY